jgi:hypothetical protein
MGAETAVIATEHREPKIENGNRECGCRKVHRRQRREKGPCRAEITINEHRRQCAHTRFFSRMAPSISKQGNIEGTAATTATIVCRGRGGGGRAKR